MNNKTRSIIKMIAVIIVVLMVLMHMDIVVIKPLMQHKFWLMVIASSLLLISSK